jgi:hypothetical protein
MGILLRFVGILYVYVVFMFCTANDWGSWLPWLPIVYLASYGVVRLGDD